jgi:hypothetical protein
MKIGDKLMEERRAEEINTGENYVYNIIWPHLELFENQGFPTLPFLLIKSN